MEVAPVDADEMDRAVLRSLGHAAKDGFEEDQVFAPCHLARMLQKTPGACAITADVAEIQCCMVASANTIWACSPSSNARIRGGAPWHQR